MAPPTDHELLVILGKLDENPRRGHGVFRDTDGMHGPVKQICDLRQPAYLPERTLGQAVFRNLEARTSFGHLATEISHLRNVQA